MTRFVGIVSALIFALDAVPAARAQVMLDVAKITCEQFAGYKITTPENVAIWLAAIITVSAVTQSSICKSFWQIRKRCKDIVCKILKHWS
jgi:HdeA/HdeB family